MTKNTEYVNITHDKKAIEFAKKLNVPILTYRGLKFVKEVHVEK